MRADPPPLQGRVSKKQRLFVEHPTGKDMRRFSTALFLAGAVLLAMLCGLQQASAQPIASPARPVAAPVPRGAACHNGMSFDRFLADLKQQAVAAGVSQRTIAEASPYLVYAHGIGNRDRGQRRFRAVVTQFPRPL